MNRIPSPGRPDRILESIAREVAFELRVPWRLGELRQKAAKAYETAEPPPAYLGLYQERASRWMLQRIYEQVKGAAERMDRLPPDQSNPTPAQIETALSAFSTKQWTPIEQSPPIEGWPAVERQFGLMECLGRAEVEALLDHMRRDTGDLKRRIGARKVKAIEGLAIQRNMELWLAENRPKLVPVSDVYWADFWPQLVRQANREGRGHSANGRSTAELGSDRTIARRLTKRDEQTGRMMTVSAYQIRRWRERMEELSFERYAAEVGADDEEKRAAAFVGYMQQIRTKHQRKT